MRPALHRRLAVFSCLAASLLGGTPGSALGQTGVPVESATPALTDAGRVRVYDEHLRFLANPFLEGRGPGTTGNRIAADYVEFQFARLGLRPAFSPEHSTQGENAARTSGFKQEFTAGQRAHATASSLTTQGRTEGFAHVALGFSGSASASGPLVFVGYGIQSGGPDKSYSTFAENDDLTGKVAVLLRFEPMNAEGKSKWRSEKTDGSWTSAAAIAPKLKAVLSRKPAGLIVVAPPGADDPRVNTMETTEGTARWTQPAEIPVVYLKPAEVDALLASVGSGQTLRALREQADERGGVVELGQTPVNLSVQLDRSPRITWNVGAILPGSGALADQYVIVGAHYDHVGYGFTGGSRTDEYGIIHPGADDNASGTAGLLLAARMLREQLEQNPGDRRSVLFTAFSAEEMGLLGSAFMIKNLPIEAKNVTAMLNMDMIGRLRDNSIELAGTGTAEGFNQILEPHITASGLTVKKTPGGRGPSDHATFYGAGVPVLHFFTGLHDQYHTPRDTMDLIDPAGAAKIVALVTDVTKDLATRAEPLVFTSTDRGTKASDPAQSTVGGVKVRFGIAPASYGEDEPGVPVGEVYPGTSAAEAGIKAGDRLLRWNGEAVESVEAWMPMLSKHKPGDIVDVTLKRGSEELTVRVTLKGRDSGAK